MLNQGQSAASVDVQHYNCVAVSGFHVEGYKQQKRRTRDPKRQRERRRIDQHKTLDALESDDSYTEAEEEGPIRLISKF